MRFSFRLILLFLMCFASANAQYLPVQIHNINKELTNNQINKIKVDSKKNVWIATGLDTYIVSNEVVKNITKLGPSKLLDCNDILEDSEGKIWFATNRNGIFIYDGVQFKHLSIIDGLVSNKINSLKVYNSKVFIGTQNGLSIYDLKSKTFINPNYKHFQNSKYFSVVDFMELDNRLYFATQRDGLFKITDDYRNIRMVKIRNHTNVFCLYKYKGLIYESHENYIAVYQVNDYFLNKGEHVKIPIKKALKFLDYNDKILVASVGDQNDTGGVFEVDGFKYKRILEDSELDSYSISSLAFNDANQTLFIGSRDQGVYTLDLNKDITYYVTKDHNQDIVALENNLLFLTSNGLVLKDKNQVELKSLKKSSFEASINSNKEESLPLEFLKLYKNKNFVYVRSNQGIFQIAPNLQIVKFIELPNQPPVFDSKGNIMNVVRSSSDRSDDLLGKKWNLKNKKPSFLFNAVEIGTTTYMASLDFGLYSFREGNLYSMILSKKWENYKIKRIDKNSSGNLIVATVSDGVYELDPQRNFKIVQSIKPTDLLGKNVKFITPYKNIVIVGTEAGVEFLINNNRFVFNKAFSIDSRLLKNANVIDDKLYISNHKGYYIVDLKNAYEQKREIGGINLYEIDVNGEPQHLQDLHWFNLKKSNIKLDDDSKSLNAKFEVIYPGNQENLRFQYRLSEDDPWSVMTKKREVFFNYLKEGNHELEIRVVDLGNNTTKDFKILVIKVKRTLSVWFWITLLLLSALSYFGYQWYKGFKLKEQNDFENKLMVEKQKFTLLLQLLNPHFIFNSINSIQYFILNNEIDKSLKYLGEFARMLRMTLGNSSKDFIELDKEIEYLHSYIAIENLRFNFRIQYEIDLDPEIDDCFIKIPSMVIQPFVENIFVHAFDDFSINPKFSIKFRLINEHLMSCVLEDNGKGVVKNHNYKQHKIKGIDLVKTKLDSLDDYSSQDVQLLHEEGVGTKVILKFKI